MDTNVNPDGTLDNEMPVLWDPALIDVRPVFRGLMDGGLSGKDIAAMLGVAPSTVSKWRRGSAKPSEEAIQFLTLILADLIRGKERALDAMENVPLAWRLGRESELAAMRQCLLQQEAINRVLPGRSVRDGARMFKDWIHKTTPQRATTPVVVPTRIRVSA